MSEDTVSKKDMHRFILSSAMKMQDQAIEYTNEISVLSVENERMREALEEIYDKTCSSALYTRRALHLCAAEGLQKSPVPTEENKK
jgi:hypothetical protein